MPRLSRKLLSRAYNISPLLPALLRTCRTLPSARNELRWLREHVDTNFPSMKYGEDQNYSLLAHLCRQRSRGVPLQYLLGSQPFGELDIICRPGVLIPRPETEAYTAHLADAIKSDPTFKGFTTVKILDLCTGTGCIPLSLYSLLSESFPSLEFLGVDISEKALNLSRKNLEYNIAKGHLPEGAKHRVSFQKGDVLHKKFPHEIIPQYGAWDIVISNPPYISSQSFSHDTTRSVRNFEPRLALVPPEISETMINIDDCKHLRQEDIFYAAILKVALTSQSKIVLMEVADTAQAVRVAMHAKDLEHFRSVELWRDWPDRTVEKISRAWGESKDTRKEYNFEIKGQGNGRSVVCWR